MLFVDDLAAGLIDITENPINNLGIQSETSGLESAPVDKDIKRTITGIGEGATFNPEPNKLLSKIYNDDRCS